MPPLDHLAATASVDLFFERTITGLPAKLRNDPTAGALFVNLCRLTDKALREYEAARGLLGEYRNDGAQRVVNPLLVIDHNGELHRGNVPRRAEREAIVRERNSD